MIYAFIAAIALGVGYGPPSNREIIDVMQKRYQVGEGLFVDPYEQVEQYTDHFNAFPSDAILKKCDPVEFDGGFAGINGRMFKNGYRCLVELVPTALPSFHVFGVFSYDGIEWRYLGEDKPREFRAQETLNRTRTRNGRIILKPGSLPYDPFPENPINDVASPYRDLLGLGGL